MCFNIDESRSIVAVILTNIQNKFLSFLVILTKEQPMHRPHSGAFIHIEVNFNKIEKNTDLNGIYTTQTMFNVVTSEKSPTITTKSVLPLGN